MKTFLLCLVTLGVLSAQTPEIPGNWQGTLTVGPQQLRLVVKVDRTGGNLGAVFYSIDQTPNPIPTTQVTLQNSVFKLAIPVLGGSYEGKLAADGNSLTGTFTQNGNPLPLNLVRATPGTAWAIPEPPPPPVLMSASNPVHVEVATVKHAAPENRGRLYTFRGDLVMAINPTLINLVTFAYDLHERQISGLPPWANDEKFDISIKPDLSGQPSITQMKKLFQEVLVDRFQLKFHTEKRQLSVYAITLPTGKPHKLTKSTATGDLPSMLYPRGGLLPARNATMLDFAQSLQTAVLDRPVVDKTGLAGRWDFPLDWMPDETQFASFGPVGKLTDNGKPNIFQAFQEQLGLKLEGVQAPADVMVVDKVDKPLGN